MSDTDKKDNGQRRRQRHRHKKTCDERLSLTRTQLNTLFDGASLFKLFDGASLLKLDTCYNWPSNQLRASFMHPYDDLHLLQHETVHKAFNLNFS